MANPELIHVPLSPLDHVMPPTYPRVGLYIPLKPNANPAEIFRELHEGLRQTLIQQPWLGGKVYRQTPGGPKWRPGQAELRYTRLGADAPRPYQLRFKEIASERSYDELAEDGFPLDAFKAADVICTPPLVGDLEAGADVLIAQANFFTGGCLLVMSTCHIVLDGVAMMTILRLWSTNCRALHNNIDPEELIPDTYEADRTLFERIWHQDAASAGTTAKADPWARDLLGAEPAMPAIADHEKDVRSLVPKPMQTRLFYMSRDSMTELQKECSVGAGPQPPSGNHAFSAMLWRATSKALVSAGHARLPEAAVLELLIDGRPDFSQAVPQSFMGNVIFFHHTTLPLAELTGPEMGLASIAQAVSAEARRIDRSSLHDAFSHLLDVPDFALVRPRFYGDRDTTVLDISNLMVFPVDDIRFDLEGFAKDGCPEAVRVFVEPVPVGNLIRVILIMPRKKHCGVEFIMQLSEDEMDCLLKDEEFARFCMPV